MRLETDRLIIEPLSLENLDDYAAIVADPEVQTWLNQGYPRDRDYACDYIKNLCKILNELGFTRYGVFDKVDGSLLGHCGFKDIDGRIDIGWTYARRAWGKGIGTEAAAAVIAFGFQYLTFDLITARADPKNLGSIGVMRSVGMTEVRSFTWHLNDDPEQRGYPIVEYHISRGSWEQAMTLQPEI